MNMLVVTRPSTTLPQIFRVIAASCCTSLQVRAGSHRFFAEGVTKTELLAIRFGTPENAALFKVRTLAQCECSEYTDPNSRRSISVRLRNSTKSWMEPHPAVALLFPVQPQPRPKKKQRKDPRLEEPRPYLSHYDTCKNKHRRPAALLFSLEDTKSINIRFSIYSILDCICSIEPVKASKLSPPMWRYLNTYDTSAFHINN
jgi:hypothetical protein